MRYFWQFFFFIVSITTIIVLFFALSVRVRDSISFTGDDQITEPEITSADPTLGPATAKITLVSYEDYQCESCAQFETVLKTLRTNYGTSLRTVWKDMPNSTLHTEAIPAAVAARCAGKQGKFWEFHDTLMMNQALLGADFYVSAASALKLKTNAFAQCLENQETFALVERGYDEGIALGVNATPTVFINGERYSGDLTVTALTRYFDDLLHAM